MHLYLYEIKSHLSLGSGNVHGHILRLYKETQEELKPAKCKLPYGITVQGKIHLSILFLPEVD